MKAMHKANNISTGLDENVTNLLYRLVKIRAKSPFTLYFNHKFVIFYTFLEFICEGHEVSSRYKWPYVIYEDFYLLSF